MPRKRDNLKLLCTIFSHKSILVDGERRITYGKFFKQASIVGQFLKERKVDLSKPIGIYMSNSIEAVVSFVGVNRIGGCYCIVDPSFPKERNELICSMADFSCIIAKDEDIVELSKIAPSAVIFPISEILQNRYKKIERPEIDMQKPMVLYFTSGSTGKPKGVIHSYDYFLNGTEKQKEFLRRSQLRWDCILPLSFAGSLIILVGIFAGATTYFYDIKKQGTAEYIQWLKKNKINASAMTVSAFRAITAIDNKKVFTNHKSLVFLGEPVLRSDLELFRQVAGKKTRLRITYGSTEAVMVSDFTFYKVDPIPEKVPAGRINSRLEVMILDENYNELPIGEVGEIAAHSPFLSKAYYKSEEESKKTFVKDKAGRNILLTGDLGYIDSDGLLYHEGRKDFMIKIRGYRADIKEVERNIHEYPGVKEAIVVGNRKEFTVDWLVAFITCYSNIDIDQLRMNLGAKLPEYMVPRKIIELEQFPLGSTGKTDRKKLMTLALSDLDQLEKDQSKRTSTEKNKLYALVEAIWVDELGIKKIGKQNDFFNDLGGDSLLAAKMLSRIEKELGKKLPLSLIFRYRSLETFVQYLEGRSDKKAEVHLKKKGTPGSPAVFLIPALKGGVQSFGEMYKLFSDEIWVYFVSFDIVDADNRHFISLNEMMDTLAREIYHTGHEKVMVFGYSFGGLLAYETATRLQEKCKVIPAIIDVPPVINRKLSFFSELFDVVKHQFKKEGAEGDVELQKIKDNVRRRWAYLFIGKNNLRIKAFEAKNIHTLYSSAHVRLYKQIDHQKLNSDAVLVCSTKNRTWGKPYSEGSRQKWNRYVEGELTVKWIEGTHEQLFARKKLAEIVTIIQKYL